MSTCSVWSQSMYAYIWQMYQHVWLSTPTLHRLSHGRLRGELLQDHGVL